MLKGFVFNLNKIMAKIIKTRMFEKKAYQSYDDQPGYINRDVGGEGFGLYFTSCPSESEETSKKKNWKKKRKKKNQEEEMPKGSI
jgi:hypothetical protein